MTKTMITCIFGIVLVGCGDISRIDQDTIRPDALESMASGAPIRTEVPPSYGPRTAARTPPVFPRDNPSAGASDAQTWRLTQQTNAIARAPSTQPVSQPDIDELRRQRMQAEAIAGSGMPARPVLGAGSGNGTFTFPAPSSSSNLSGAISRANATEASAVNR